MIKDQLKKELNKIFEKQYSFSKNDNDVKKIWISPKTFLKTTHKEGQLRNSPFKSYKGYVQAIINRNSVEGIKEAIKTKSKRLPFPFLEFNPEGKPVGHEGRNTAKALEELGFKKMPVFKVINYRVYKSFL